MYHIKQELLELLSNDIIHKIISYTYSIQNKELLNDIKSFHNTKLEIKNKYMIKYNSLFTRYNWYEYNNLYKSYIFCLVDELYIYMKTKINSKNIYNYILERSFKNRTFEKAKMYLNKIGLLEQETQLNILWGILKPNERKLFITKMDIFYN